MKLSRDPAVPIGTKTYIVSGRSASDSYDESGRARRVSLAQHLSSASSGAPVLAAHAPGAHSVLAEREEARELFAEWRVPLRTIVAGRVGVVSAPMQILTMVANGIARLLVPSRRSEFRVGALTVSQRIVSGNSGSPLFDSGTHEVVGLMNASDMFTSSAHPIDRILGDLRDRLTAGTIAPDSVTAVRELVEGKAPTSSPLEP